MKGINFRAIFAVVIGFCASYGAIAQNDITAADKYLISAKAGGVNYIYGTVTIIRATGKSGVLLKSDQVEIGDRVTTGTDGRAEVLLNPGSFIRLGKNSSFEFGSTDLEDLQLRLDSGSATFEVYASDEFRVTVLTPKGKVALVETGVYRIDISPDGSGVIAVTNGKAEIGELNPVAIKDGRTGTIGTDTVAIAKFDKDKRDELGEWSRMRSMETTAMNANLQNQAVRNSLITGYRNGQWGINNSFGLWVYNAMFGRYSFLPFGSNWSSPYGYGYSTGIYWTNLTPNSIDRKTTPRVIRGDVGPPSPDVKNTTRIRANQEVPNSDSKNSSRVSRDSYQPPPYTKVDRGGSGDSGSRIRNSDFSSSDSGSSRDSGSRVTSSPSSTYSMPVSSPAAPAADVKSTPRIGN